MDDMSELWSECCGHTIDNCQTFLARCRVLRLACGLFFCRRGSRMRHSRERSGISHSNSNMNAVRQRVKETSARLAGPMSSWTLRLPLLYNRKEIIFGRRMKERARNGLGGCGM
jgi:hypothetical protein